MNLNEIKCIFCNIESNKVVIEENGYKGKKCPQCGLIYVSPRPSFEEIVDLYGHDNAFISADSHIEAGFSKRLYARHNLRIINTVIKNGELLEIGAGAGYFLHEARKIGFKPHGLEFNPIQANHIRSTLNIPCEESSISKSVFNGKQFDIVYHCDVISHFFDPISDFRKINDKMKDGSFLIFETGNLGEVDKRYFKYIQRFQYPDHLFFFSTENLINLLEKTGFELLDIHRYSILPQLMMITTKSWAVKYIKKYVIKSTEREVNFTEGRSISKKAATNQYKSLVMQIVKNVYEFLIYLLRYKIGAIAPKKHRPQTVIVVAKKCNSYPDTPFME